MTESQPRESRTPPCPAIAVIEIRVPVGAPIDAAWEQIGGFLDLGRHLAVPCAYLSGNGEVGSVRLIGESVVEVLVDYRRHGYAYTQTAGPMAAFAYHGTMRLEPSGENSCELVYTLIYDESSLGPEQRSSERSRLTRRFQGAAESMKRAAEAAAG